MDFRFGLWGSCPDGVPAAWGARLIVERGWKHQEWKRKVDALYHRSPNATKKQELRYCGKEPDEWVLDMVWDRCTLEGDSKEEGSKLTAVLDGGVLQKAFDKARDLLNKGEMQFAEPGLFTLFNDGKTTVLGDTNGSCGYLYVIAYPVREKHEGREEEGEEAHPGC